MRITELFTAKSIELDSAASNRDEILSRLVELQATHGNITDTEAYKKARSPRRHLRVPRGRSCPALLRGSCRWQRGGCRDPEPAQEKPHRRCLICHSPSSFTI